MNVLSATELYTYKIAEMVTFKLYTLHFNLKNYFHVKKQRNEQELGRQSGGKEVPQNHGRGECPQKARALKWGHRMPKGKEVGH